MGQVTDTAQFRHSVQPAFANGACYCVWHEADSELQSVRVRDENEAAAAIPEEDARFVRACRPRIAKILSDEDR